MLKGFAFGVSCGAQAIPRFAYTVEQRSVVLDPLTDAPGRRLPRRVARRERRDRARRSPSPRRRRPRRPPALYDRDSARLVRALPRRLVDRERRRRGDRPARSRSRGRASATCAISVIGGIAHLAGRARRMEPRRPIVLSFSHAVDRALLPADELAAHEPVLADRALRRGSGEPRLRRAHPLHASRCATTRRRAAAPTTRSSSSRRSCCAPSGRYAVVVTQRLFAAGDPARPIRRVAVLRSRALAEPAALLDARRARDPRPRRAARRLPRDRAGGADLPERRRARAARLDARAALRDPSDMVAIKENALAAPPSSAHRQRASRRSAQRRLIVRGTLALPSYLGDPDASELTRDALGPPAVRAARGTCPSR